MDTPQTTYQYLVQEVLDKLLFQRPRGQQSMKIGSQQFGNEVAERKQHQHDSSVTFLNRNSHIL